MLWAFLFIFVIAPVVGVLLALSLRELHIRHPLPLGGAIASLRKPPKTNIVVPEITEIQEDVDDSVDPGESDEPVDLTEESDVDIGSVMTALMTPVLPKRENVAKNAAVSVFEGANNTREDLAVTDTLNAMTAERSTTVPHALERRIEEEAARASTIIPPAMSELNDDMDGDDLRALADALPKVPIDFATELETDAENSDPISQMAKETLGENFDFDALEQQSKEIFRSLAPDTGESNSALDATAPDLLAAIDIQEDGLGKVQASSPVMFRETPQLADFKVPETIVSSFSGDWIQEMNASLDPITGDKTTLCFTEEPRAMLVRKKKSH